MDAEAVGARGGGAGGDAPGHAERWVMLGPQRQASWGGAGGDVPGHAERWVMLGPQRQAPWGGAGGIADLFAARDSAPVHGPCRFCAAPDCRSRYLNSIVCRSPGCDVKLRFACSVVLPCGHYCGGARGEPEHPPCNEGCQGDARFTAADECPICMDDSLAAAPALRLACGHRFHAACIDTLLARRWAGRLVSFRYLGCPVCAADIAHATLFPRLAAGHALRARVLALAAERLRDESLAPAGAPPAALAAAGLARYAFYECGKCHAPFVGGARECEAGAGDEAAPDDVECDACRCGAVASRRGGSRYSCSQGQGGRRGARVQAARQRLPRVQVPLLL